MISWEWLGTNVGTAFITAVVTLLVVRRVKNGGNGVNRVMLNKLDTACNNLAALESLPATMGQVVQLLGEIKGLLSRR